MRILASADVHGFMDVYEWLLEAAVAHRVDLWILAGDLFAAGHPSSQRRQGETILKLLGRSPAPVFFLMGNDDYVEMPEDGERVRLLHGRRLEHGGYSFVGYQYTPPFFGNVFVKEEPEIASDLQVLAPLVDEATVVVTHTPSRGILDQVRGEATGSSSLAAMLKRRPFLAHIHGHIHEAFGRDGRHFNVASAGRRRAVLVDLPSLESRVL